MASKIRIKRSTGTVAPGSLLFGELGVTLDGSGNQGNRGDRLFISLLGSAFIHLFWLALVGSVLWLATIICVGYAIAVFRYV